MAPGCRPSTAHQKLVRIFFLYRVTRWLIFNGRKGWGTFSQPEEARYIYKLLLVLFLPCECAAGKSNFIFILNGISLFFFGGGWGFRYTIQFIGKRGIRFRGDTAIDDISLSPECSGIGTLIRKTLLLLCSSFLLFILRHSYSMNS